METRTSPIQVNFSRGDKNVEIDVGIIIKDDGKLEGYEKFNVSIHNFTMPCGVVVLCENVTAEVIILDNYSKCTYNNNHKF